MAWEFIKDGGPVMVPLLLCSVVALALILERTWGLRRGRVIPRGASARLLDSKTSPSDAASAIPKRGSVLGRLIHGIDAASNATYVDAARELELRARREATRLDRGLVGLEIIVGVAPLLGLAGTIHGLIALFGSIGDLSQADGAQLARGIGIALNTTFLGLLIAIPSLIAWNYFDKRVENLVVELEELCGLYLARRYRGARTSNEDADS